MVNTEIRLIIFFSAKDGEAVYSQQKQDWELTVAQIMNFLLPNSDLNFTGTTQRDGMGREEGGGFRMGNTCIPVADSF